MEMEYITDLEHFFKKHILDKNNCYLYYNDEDLKNELKNLDKKLKDYENNILMYNFLYNILKTPSPIFTSILDDDNTNDATYSILTDLWLLREYDENILLKFSTLKKIFTLIKDGNVPTEKDISNIEHDFLILDREHFLENREQWITSYENIIYYLINRFEEYEYDVNNYEYNYVDKIDYKMDIIKLIIKHNNRVKFL